MNVTRVLSVAVILAATTASSATTPPQYQAVRAAKSPVVDGDLTDEAWASAPEMTGFIQRDPQEGQPATQQTRVKVVYDDDAIYFGAVMEDDGPVTELLARRDSDLNNGDYIRISLDPALDRQNGASFYVNASNVQMDSALHIDIAEDTTWDGVWSSATKIGPKGWTAEVRIPYSQLSFQKKDVHTWGFNVTRWQARLRESSRLVFTPKTETGFVSRFADLTGITGISPRRGFELVPYGVARTDLYSRADNPFVSPSEHRMDAGLDMKYRLSSSLTLTGTINPDFGQVEVDPAVLNLSQFETSFPEKRPFFTEGANVFRFGSGPAQSRWGFSVWFPAFFYSRRIGRSPQGWVDAAFIDEEDGVYDAIDHELAPVDTTILGAAKLTGKVGKGWSVGVLDALTDREDAWFRTGSLTGKQAVEPMTNYLVARAAKEYGKDSRAGFLFTSVNRRLTDNLDPKLRESAYFGGIDGYTRFKDKSWLWDWWVGSSLVRGSEEAITSTQESAARYYGRPDAGHIELDPTRTSLTGWGGRTMLAKQTGKWRPNFQVQVVSPGLELNDVGLLQRTDNIATHGVLQYLNTDVTKYTREISAWAAKHQNWNFDNDLISDGTAGEYFVQWKNYLRTWVWGGTQADHLDDRITRGGPAMIYRAHHYYGFGIGNDSRKKYFGEFWTEQVKDDFSGTYGTYALTLTYRPVPSLRFSLTPRYSDLTEVAQYVTQVEDAAYEPTFGKRYIFATLDQKTLDIGIRGEWTASSRLSMQLYLQPFIASGAYHDFKYLTRARDDEFTPIGNAQAKAEAGDVDFNLRSVRGSAVVRWEFRPGSAMYVVWSENRAEEVGVGDFKLRRDFSALPNAPSQDVFLVKFSYWLPL
jgi:Domain of unknown function (DUF5916)/Carbohydrate family 9 binding domain-like